MGPAAKQHENTYFRRQFPRRAMKKKVGILNDGSYFVADTYEIGEGGLAIVSEFVMTQGHKLVVSFQIPGGDFVFLRATILSTKKHENGTSVIHGLSFDEIAFSIKRQIRAYVSSREGGIKDFKG